MKYKVGDRVQVQSFGWIEKNKKFTEVFGIPIGFTVTCGENGMVDDMFIYAGAIATITGIVSEGQYSIDLDGGDWNWTDGMFERKLTDVIKSA